MQVLEKRSGVGRETIRYYIRLGLLPEPDRPRPNVAAYTEEHVRRLKLIKRLQAERYMPLSYIKTILDRPEQAEAETIPGFDLMLAEALGINPRGPMVGLDVAAAETSVPRAEIETLAANGLFFINNGQLSPLDMATLRIWARLRMGGFDQDMGFFPEDVSLYAQVLAPLAVREVDRFMFRVGGAVTSEQAARLAHNGLNVVNELMNLMRANFLLRRVGELSQQNGLPTLKDDDGGSRYAGARAPLRHQPSPSAE